MENSNPTLMVVDDDRLVLAPPESLASGAKVGVAGK